MGCEVPENIIVHGRISPELRKPWSPLSCYVVRVLVETNPMRWLYGSIETINDIFPTASVSFPLKLTMTMSLGMKSVSGMLMCRKMEEKIRLPLIYGR